MATLRFTRDINLIKSIARHPCVSVDCLGYVPKLEYSPYPDAGYIRRKRLVSEDRDTMVLLVMALNAINTAPNIEYRLVDINEYNGWKSLWIVIEVFIVPHPRRGVRSHKVPVRWSVTIENLNRIGLSIITEYAHAV